MVIGLNTVEIIWIIFIFFYLTPIIAKGDKLPLPKLKKNYRILCWLLPLFTALHAVVIYVSEVGMYREVIAWGGASACFLKIYDKKIKKRELEQENNLNMTNE